MTQEAPLEDVEGIVPRLREEIRRLRRRIAALEEAEAARRRVQ